MTEKVKTKEIFDLVVKTTLHAIKQFAANPKVPNFQVLDILMPKERKIRSIVGGLETSLGTTLWEPLAKELASLNGFKVCNGKEILKPVNMPGSLESTLNRVISSREKSGSTYDWRSSREEIKKACAPLISKPIQKFEKPPRGHGVDVWLRKNNVDYLLDSKTVQPNIGTYKTCLRQIMTWYAYYYAKFPTGEAKAFIFIPYNPYKVDFIKSTIGHGFPLCKDELWVQDDLWDFCTGVKGTYAIIYSAFEYISANDLIRIELDKLFKKNTP